MSKRKRRRGRANHLFLGSKAQYNVSGSLDQSFISDEHLLELEQHLYPPYADCTQWGTREGLCHGGANNQLAEIHDCVWTIPAKCKILLQKEMQGIAFNRNKAKEPGKAF